ncbi:hypothetical protein [Paenibacillus sp. TH7-28]
MKKRFLLSMLSLSVCLAFLPMTSYAEPREIVNSTGQSVIDLNTDANAERVPEELLKQANLNESAKITITDINELEKIAKEEGMDEIPVSIEYEYIPNDINSVNPNTGNIIKPQADYPRITTWDHGNGHYDKQKDLYKEFYVYGPDDFEISETTKDYNKWDGTFGIVKKDTLEAEIGFEIGHENTLDWKSTTKIKDGEKVRFQLYKTHHWVTYSLITEWKTYKGEAYEPNGTLIKKTKY